MTFTLQTTNMRVAETAAVREPDSQGSTSAPVWHAPKKGWKPPAENLSSNMTKKNFSDAVQTLSLTLTECVRVLNRFSEWDIRNDLALAQLRSGDAAACLKTLQPLHDLGSMSDEDVRGIPEPAFVDVYLRIARATRTNFRLCNAGSK
jgi:hypothetical protein